MGWLCVLDPAGKDSWHEIPAAGLVCGRGSAADLHLSHTTVSRRHARFVARDGFDELEDMGSSNGTRVNGVVLKGRTTLNSGDRVLLGELPIVYQTNPPGYLEETRRAAAPPAEDPKLAAPKPPVRKPATPKPTSAPSAEPARTRVGVSGETNGLFADTARWRQVELVGRGGMGEVYRAFDLDLAMLVAIKRLRRRADSSQSLLERMHAREAAIARTIRHPNVVQALEDGVHDGDPYLLLEWVEGTTFDRYLRTADADHATKSDYGDKLECLRQIALAVAAAHDAGVVHSDLKPANILVLAAQSPQAFAGGGVLESPEELSVMEPAAPTVPIDAGLATEILRRVLPSIEALLDEPPFVGRETELEFLREISREAIITNSRRWVLLCGARGAGKRRLCREFVAAIARGECGPVEVHVDEDGVAPPAEARGLWISLFPEQLPEDPELVDAIERERLRGAVRELYLKGFLRGQSVRLVESVVRHAPSARGFLERVEAEIGASPQRLIERLRRSFADHCWTASGQGYVLDERRLEPDLTTQARELLERLGREEKGFRDFLSTIAPLGSCLDFETLLHSTELDSAALYYLLEHGVKSGYLVRRATGEYRIGSEMLRAHLERAVESRMRERLVRRALPHLERRLESGRVPTELYAQVGDLAVQSDRHDRGFRAYVAGALVARRRYEDALFIRCADAARELYRTSVRDRGVHRALTAALDEMLGVGGRGLTGLDRLRRLPVQVRVRITDFGIARRLVTGASAGLGAAAPVRDEQGPPVWGTPRYMSPEQARRDELTTASDIYSLGIILREAFEGEHPLGALRGLEAVSVIRQRGIEPPKAGGGVPEPMIALVTAMLAADPGARPSATEVARALETYQLAQALKAYDR
ncbi:MAG: protein kinase domain-containing protein [Planctomycetota bacterium]